MSRVRPGAEEVVVSGDVMGFPAGTGHGFALREGVLAARSAVDWRGGDKSTDSDDPRLPPRRLGASYADSGGMALASPPSSSSSSDAFLSMSSTPSGLQNPYGVWSAQQAPSEASSSEMDFRSAREYDTADLFFGENWLYDDHLFHRRRRRPSPNRSGGGCDGVPRHPRLDAAAGAGELWPGAGAGELWPGEGRRGLNSCGSSPRPRGVRHNGRKKR